MVKFVQCVTRKPGMEAAEFRRHWMEYGSRVESIVRERPNIVRFRLTTTLLVKDTVTFMIKYGSSAPFDGMVELWLDDAMVASANLRSDKQTEALLNECHDFLAKFVDRDKSTAFFAKEEMAYDRELASANRT